MTEDDAVKPPVVVERGAHQHGWVRRSDLGSDVWESPDGRLHKAPPDSGEPTILTYSPVLLSEVIKVNARE